MYARRDICGGKALSRRRISNHQPGIPSRRSARGCVLGSNQEIGVTNMASEDESEETKTEDDYTPGKFFNFLFCTTFLYFFSDAQSIG